MTTIPWRNYCHKPDTQNGNQGKPVKSKPRDKQNAPILRTFLLEPSQSQPPQALRWQTQSDLRQSLGPDSQAHGGKKRHGRHLGAESKKFLSHPCKSWLARHRRSHSLQLTWPQLPSIYRHLCRKRRVHWLVEMDDNNISAKAWYKSFQRHLVLGGKRKIKKLPKLQSYKAMNKNHRIFSG